MKRRESRKFSILAGVIVSVLWSGLALSAETLQKIRFAIASRSNIVAPKHIAISKGFFKAEGLEVELIQMNPRLSATALVNEDVSYGGVYCLRGSKKERTWSRNPNRLVSTTHPYVMNG